MRPSDMTPGQVVLAKRGPHECVLVSDQEGDWKSVYLDDGLELSSSRADHADSFWTDVRPLVEGRPVTRDDLPTSHEAWDDVVAVRPGSFGDVEQEDVSRVLDVVVEHLNARGGVPADDGVVDIPVVDDPLVFEVRESDLPEVKVVNGNYWADGRSVGPVDYLPALTCRNNATALLRSVARYEAVARAIEAERAAKSDRAEELARELWDVARAGSDVEWDDLTPTTQAEHRRIATHVLAKEADQ